MDKKAPIVLYIIIWLGISLIISSFTHIDGLGIFGIVLAIMFFGYIYCANPQPNGGGGGGDRIQSNAVYAKERIYSDKFIALAVSMLTGMTQFLLDNYSKLTDDQVIKIKEAYENIISKVNSKPGPETTPPTDRTYKKN